MATLAELQAAETDLEAQRHSGVARVTVDGRTVTYRGLDEIEKALTAVRAEIKKKQDSSRPVNQVKTYTTKGL